MQLSTKFVLKINNDNTVNMSTSQYHPIVSLMSQEAYQKLHKSTYLEPKQKDLKYVHEELEKANLKIVDTSEEIKLPIPNLTFPLVRWINKAIEHNYEEYFWLADTLCGLNVAEMDLPKSASSITGWSKYVNGKWVQCEGIETEACVMDFECFRRTKKDKFLPFMLSAIDMNGTVYSWMELQADKLPDVVAFGDTFKLILGHNAVSFDSQYIKEFYKDFHHHRIFDTYSLYSAMYGMSERQTKLFNFFDNMPIKPKWVRKTCRGNLKELAKFLCNIDIDKGIKQELILQTKKKLTKEDLEDHSEDGGIGKNFLNFSEITSRIDDVWNYCLNDTIACLEIFKKLYKIAKGYDTKIYLAGQLERSILCITCDEKFHERIERVRKHNDQALQRVNTQIEKCLATKRRNRDPILFEYIRGFLMKDYLERIWKSSKFKYKKIEDIPQEILDHTILPKCLELLGWEEDEADEGAKAEQKAITIKKLKAAAHELNEGYECKCQPGTIDKWLKHLRKAADDKVSIEHISLAGKATPYIIGLKYNGLPVVISKNTWGTYTEGGEFIPLKHPSGEGNVGNPLSKDFYAEAKNKRLTADIDLIKFFEDVSETLLWEKFDKRFRVLHIYNNKWKVNIRPSGTVTRRAVGSLALLLANTKPSRAGSEMKSFFMSRLGMAWLGADYEGQEAEIFCALLDAEMGNPGLLPYSVIVHCGDSDLGTDIHSFVANTLSSYATSLIGTPLKIKRQNGKNMNFANQFLGGVTRISTMLYLALDGVVSMEICTEVVKYFQKFTRGEKQGKKYYGGLASIAFNRLLELAKDEEKTQTCLLTGCRISTALDAAWCEEKFKLGDKDYTAGELTTRANFTIQGGGQGLIDICLIVVRYFADKLDIPYNFIYFVHDQVRFETPMEYAQDMMYLMQLGHLFSKAIMYKKFGCQGIPTNKMYFRSIEREIMERKSPFDPCVTPSQPEAPGRYLVTNLVENHPSSELSQFFNSEDLGVYKTADCFPTPRVAKMIAEMVF